MEQSLNIVSLPAELIEVILQNNDCFDIVRFSSTCKRFYNLIYNSQLLWRDKFKTLVPQDVFGIINRQSDINWLQEVKTFFNIKQKIFSELSLMSSKYYWQRTEIGFEEVSAFFYIAFTNKVCYYYTMYILQELIRKGNQNLNTQYVVKPYTLTDIYYAKIVLQHLMSTYLTVKWIQCYTKNELHPEFVVNFFMQWVDSMNMHHYEEVEKLISDLVSKVENILVKNPNTGSKPGDELKNMCAKKQIQESEILAAITQVIYHRPHMRATVAANLETLDIIKVMDNKCGNILVLGAIYHAVARGCGVRCDLITFPNHLFLEWRDHFQQKYRINLDYGHLQTMRGCPFSGNLRNDAYKYNPNSLLQYIVVSFNCTMGAISNMYVQNASYLREFMNTDSNSLAISNPYCKFLKILFEHNDESTAAIPIDMKYLHENYKDIILRLITNNKRTLNTKRSPKKDVIHRRDSRVKYAVGMICYHKTYNYVCIIRAWDLIGAPQWKQMSDIANLQYGTMQPFYHVIAVDQSNRYIAQEHLIEVIQPVRLYHLEDHIASEFSHFNGFAYIPNPEKHAEYPDDSDVVEMFQTAMARQISEKSTQLTKK